MASFAETFRVLVIPGLRETARSAAFLVSRGRIDFTEARGWVMRDARRYGSSYMANPDRLALEEWVDTTILKFLADFETNQAAGAAFVSEMVPPP